MTLALTGILLAACAADPAASPETLRTTFDTGLKAYDAGDYATAYRTWSTIDEYDLAAMRNVALMLRQGKGVPKDLAAAETMMARAANAGLFTAQADLGDMLLRGEAGPPNPKAAAPWLQRAAAAGHPQAAFELGQLYEHGIAVSKDIGKARQLYRYAAMHGVKDAAASLAALPQTFTP